MPIKHSSTIEQLEWMTIKDLRFKKLLKEYSVRKLLISSDSITQNYRPFSKSTFHKTLTAKWVSIGSN